MEKLKRKFLVNSLLNTLDRIIVENDYYRRSLMVTRALGILCDFGNDIEVYFELDNRYQILHNEGFRAYKDRLNGIIDHDDMGQRQDEVLGFYYWMHDIRLLHPDE